jgi:hypothetical protein
MVYVEDLSSNGSRYKPVSAEGQESSSLRPLGKTSGTILLSDGDQVFLTPSISFVFRFNPQLVSVEEQLLEVWQQQERKVNIRPSTCVTNSLTSYSPDL